MDMITSVALSDCVKMLMKIILAVVKGRRNCGIVIMHHAAER